MGPAKREPAQHWVLPDRALPKGPLAREDLHLKPSAHDAAACGTLPTCGPRDVDALTAGQVHQVELAHLDALAHAAQGVHGGVPRFAHACTRIRAVVAQRLWSASHEARGDFAHAYSRQSTGIMCTASLGRMVGRCLPAGGFSEQLWLRPSQSLHAMVMCALPMSAALMG